MSSYSDHDSISFCGRIEILDTSLNKLRLVKGWFNGSYTLIPKEIDISQDGIFIPSLCTLTQTTIDLIRKIYGASYKRLIDRDFLLYICDNDGTHFEGIWIPIKSVCEYFKIDNIALTSSNVTLEKLYEMGIIVEYDYFLRVMGENDIRFLKFDEQLMNIHELVHGDVFKLSQSKFLKRLKISNSSIDREDFTDLKISNMDVFMVKPRKNAGPVNFHVNNTASKGRYGKYLILSYEYSQKYYLKTAIQNNNNISYDELKILFDDKFNLSPKIDTVIADKKTLIRYCDGKAKNKSTLGDHIMKGLELFTTEGRSYTYLSSFYLASCSDSTIWS